MAFSVLQVSGKIGIISIEAKVETVQAREKTGSTFAPEMTPIFRGGGSYCSFRAHVSMAEP